MARDCGVPFGRICLIVVIPRGFLTTLKALLATEEPWKGI
jgi:hypothetical protein